eukprot:2231533-Rhodomonas_salina.2
MHRAVRTGNAMDEREPHVCNGRGRDPRYSQRKLGFSCTFRAVVCGIKRVSDCTCSVLTNCTCNVPLNIQWMLIERYVHVSAKHGGRQSKGAGGESQAGRERGADRHAYSDTQR